MIAYTLSSSLWMVLGGVGSIIMDRGINVSVSSISSNYHWLSMVSLVSLLPGILFSSSSYINNGGISAWI